MLLYVLYEQAAGYALFQVAEFEDTSIFLPLVESSVTDLSRFNQIVKLKAFAPFESAVMDAVVNMNVSAFEYGIVHETLKWFLQMNFPKSEKRKYTLGVLNKDLAANISKWLGITCTREGVVAEVVRGIRYHFSHLVEGVHELNAGVPQLRLMIGPGHTPDKVELNGRRIDSLVIHSLDCVQYLDNFINKFSMRMREWYSFHFPELYEIISDNYLFAKAVQYIGNRKELTQERLKGLEEIVMDSAKAQAILDAARSSRGADIAPIDLEHVLNFSHRLLALMDCRDSVQQDLKEGMASVAPNLSALVGEQFAAQLISRAGSLTSLAKLPRSTVLILRVEKPMLRARKTRCSTPEYRLLHNSMFIARAIRRRKGRISRLAARTGRSDYSSERSSHTFGEKLQEVEDRLTSLEIGTVPPKNTNVREQ